MVIDLIFFLLFISNVFQSPSSVDGFFHEQLMAFQAWLQFTEESARMGNGIVPQKPPEQLPIVLQVLLSKVSWSAVQFARIGCSVKKLNVAQ